MQDGAYDRDNRAIARSQRLNELTRDLPSRLLIELIRSVSPERAPEVSEALLTPGLERSLSHEITAIVESGGHDLRQFATMVVLLAREPEPVAPMDLAYALGLSVGVVRSQLRALEHEGAVTHHHNARRRRRTYVTLTRRGRVEVSRAVVLYVSALEDYGRRLPPTVGMILSHLCSAARANASRHLTSAGAAAAKSPGDASSEVHTASAPGRDRPHRSSLSGQDTAQEPLQQLHQNGKNALRSSSHP